MNRNLCYSFVLFWQGLIKEHLNDDLNAVTAHDIGQQVIYNCDSLSNETQNDLFKKFQEVLLSIYSDYEFLKICVKELVYILIVYSLRCVLGANRDYFFEYLSVKLRVYLTLLEIQDLTNEIHHYLTFNDKL